jgi:hypothetical protein
MHVNRLMYICEVSHKMLTFHAPLKFVFSIEDHCINMWPIFQPLQDIVKYVYLGSKKNPWLKSNFQFELQNTLTLHMKLSTESPQMSVGLTTVENSGIC